MLKLFIILLLSVVSYTLSNSFKENLSDFSKCKHNYSSAEAGYKDFFNVLSTNKEEKERVLNLHFYVKTTKDAHILLVSSKFAVDGHNQSVYEIVIGANNNTQSIIRKKIKVDEKITVNTKNYVTEKEFRSFWIHANKYGVISVGLGGAEEAFMVWQDLNPLSIKKFSFGSYINTTAQWYFNCPTEARGELNEENTNTTLVCVLIFLFSGYATNAKFYHNITDFAKCKIYYSRSGSVYKDFFELNEEPQNGSLLDFHFSVMSPSDAHILLAPSSNLQKGDPVYEIVIGAGGNTFCDIRRMQKSGVKATVRVKGLLTALDPQSFWIHISEDGVIEVGKEGEELAFLSWIDPDPLPLKVFSFSTWPGIEAKWFFDCPREKNGTENSKMIEKPLTPLEKLRQDLLFYYDPYVRPVKNATTITTVGLKLGTNIVTLNEYKSVLQYSGTISLTWHDEKLHWNTSEYGDINTLHIFRREIWIPELFLFNAIAENGELLEDTMLTVNSTGHVKWITTININSWCSPDDLGRWPRDEHQCDIVLGFFNEFQNLQLAFNANESTFNCPYSSRWAILEVESFSNRGWQNSSVRNLNNFDPPGLTLHLKLRRTSNSYTIILFTPFFIVAVSLLTTFWVSPFGYLKLSLACLPLVVSSVVLLTLGILIPTHSQQVPNLVLLYSYSLVAIMLCIVIETFVINISRNQQSCALPHFVTKILLSVFLKMFLCLPAVKYGNLNDSLKSKESHQTMWIFLGVVIDRVAFFVYLGFVVYALCVTY
ncbi:hypothetical protein TcasGA2_TC033650 [Tribolium castaneum]|uniref:Uncharacterized protein n=1 Tax=Tribolium castaneum TaxID=7070 RepID=A0A139WFS6_TRICA|nr:hypothetical protein TcasGA2_TC033650 [Tribolium castaneum]